MLDDTYLPPDMNLEKLNESDVREEIIAPLIRHLGYRSDSSNNVLREVSLRYPLTFFGRKSPRKDQALRGKADYILEVGRKINWVIEAKAPTASISIDDIEQAYTYANHAEIRAVYFVLCNGHELLIFQTNAGPHVDPILRLTYAQLRSEPGWRTLQNVLSPSAIFRDHPIQTVDVAPPIGPGLRSFARVSGGYIEYDHMVPENKALLQMKISVVNGSIQRAEDGTLIALIESRAPMRTVDDFLIKNKLTTIEARSFDTSISDNPDSPTRFQCKTETIFPAGDVLLDLNTWQEHIIPFDLNVEIDFTANGLCCINQLSA